MKRLLAGGGALTAILIVALLISTSATLGSVPRAHVKAHAASKTLNIALVTGDNHDPFYVTMHKGALAAAAKMNAKVSWNGPSVYGAAAQISILDTILASKPNALLVAPDDVKALINTLHQFDQAHVPVITLDTDVNNHSVRLGNITSNNILGGKVAAQFLAKSLHKGSQVVYVGEPTGISTTDQRERGFMIGAKAVGFKALTPQFGTDDDPNTATTLVSELLQRYPNLKGIFASDTSWGQGAATAIQNAGKTGKVKIVAFDAEPEEVADLKRGTIQALIVQKAYLEGYDAVEYAVNYIRNHKKVPAETNPSFVVATKSNINQPSVLKYVYSQK